MEKNISKLAANLFIQTQIRDKLERDYIIDKEQANKIHEVVSKKVHETIKDLEGINYAN